ncbi:MAG: sugar phosphate isomerase/epimerase, partial [Victivallales bacterium]|nr:sugar phosphate isomerase/epimerase [Victivallales bacterium]
KMLGTMSDEEFAAVEEALADSGVSINCYGSAIANWQRHPRSDEDFQLSRNELLTAIPRMKRLGIGMVRGMSFLVPEDEAAGSAELEKIAYSKVKELVQICADNGIIYGHENCMNIGGMSWQHTMRMLEFVDSPALKLIYDTGNPCFLLRRIGPAPWTIQSSWEYYRQVREHIAYVHIKDATACINSDGKVDELTFTWAGEGNGDIRAIVTDLRKRGYDGGFSMEPHLATVFHDEDADNGGRELNKKEIYVEYGRRFMQLMRECGWKF